MRVVVACVAVLALLASGCGRMPATSSVPPRSFAAAAKEGFDVTKLRATERRLSATPATHERARQVVPRAWVRESTRRQISISGGYAYGYRWWINTGRHGGFLAQGHLGQTIEVFPRLSLVIVLTGVGADPRPLTRLLLDAIES